MVTCIFRRTRGVYDEVVLYLDIYLLYVEILAMVIRKVEVICIKMNLKNIKFHFMQITSPLFSKPLKKMLGEYFIFCTNFVIYPG